MLTPTGERIELANGSARAEVGTVAAMLCSLRIGDVALTEPIARRRGARASATASCWCPWPNRVRDARWTLRRPRAAARHHRAGPGQRPPRPAAVHRARGARSARMPPSPSARPSRPSTAGRSCSTPGCASTLAPGRDRRHARRASTPATLPAPYATGTHPFLRIGDVPIERAQLSTIAGGELLRRRRAAQPDRRAAVVVDTPYDLRDAASRGRPRPRHRLRRAVDARDRVVGDVLAGARRRDRSRCCRTTTGSTCRSSRRQIYPGPNGPKTAIAVEPMTAPPDALNSGLGLRWLEPGELWEGSWGLRYAGGATR